MNKSKILTLATTAAVIATTAGTFAAWDSLTDKKAGYAVMTAEEHKININSTSLDFTNEKLEPGKTIAAPITINSTNLGSIKLAAENINIGGTPVTAGDVTVKFFEGDTEILDALGDNIVDSGENVYTVKVTLNADADASTYANKTINFDVTATGTVNVH